MILTYYDLLLTPIYLIVIYLLAKSVQNKRIKNNPEYKYYTRGLMYKLFGGIGVCLIYQFYYSGGDTTNYFQTTEAYFKLIDIDFDVFWDVVVKGNMTDENHSVFNIHSGYPVFWVDETAALVSRLLIPIYIIGAKSFVPATLILSWVCYSGVWRLYLLFVMYFPKISYQLAIAILFIPSVVFWGSGLLKDTITLAAVGWYTYQFYHLLIKRKNIKKGAVIFLVSCLLLIYIKPYIFFAILPGSIIWLLNEMISKMESRTMQKMALPIMIAIGLGGGFLILYQLSDYMGVYAVDKVLDRALEVNIDQKQDYYGGNSFDIGDFEPTIGGVMSKAHLAIAATLFRPYLWDARNPVMLMSALENIYIMLLTFFILIKLRVKKLILLIGENPLLLFSFLFSIFFAFSVGLATSNFGSLVRLKIPCIPFYVATLFVLKYFYDIRFKNKSV